MARVEVDIEQGEDEPVEASFAEEPDEDAPRQTRGGGRRRRERVEVEIEREVTKRQLIQSVSSILVVILYMLFTLLRERDSGVVVVDDEGSADDWDEPEA